MGAVDGGLSGPWSKRIDLTDRPCLLALTDLVLLAHLQKMDRVDATVQSEGSVDWTGAIQ